MAVMAQSLAVNSKRKRIMEGIVSQLPSQRLIDQCDVLVTIVPGEHR